MISMNSIKIGAGIGITIGCAVFGFQSKKLIDCAKKAAEISIREEVISERDDETMSRLAHASLEQKESLEKISQLREDRLSAGETAVSDYMTSHNTVKKFADLEKEKNQKIAKFDSDFDLKGRKKSLQDEADLRISGLKKSVDYDSKREKLVKELSEAKEKEKKMKRWADIIDDDKYNDLIKDKAADDVKEIKQKIKDLDESIEKEVQNIRKESNDEIARLENKRKQFVDKANKEYREACNSINSGICDTRQRASSEFDRSHAAEKAELDAKYDHATSVINDISDKEDRKVSELMETRNVPEMLGRYLKENKASMFLVIFIGVLPLILGEYAAYKYTMALMTIVKTMV